MKEPSLLVTRSPAIQVFWAVVVPAALGALAGVLLGVSSGAYVAVLVVATVGGVGAGYDHADILEGAGRGIAGGLLFGTFVLFGHAIANTRAKAGLPHPHVLLVVGTTLIGLLLGAIGGLVRNRRERERTARTSAA